MRGLILVLMSNVCYLFVILIFLVVTVGYLVVAARYCFLLGGYCSLLLVTARYCLFSLLVWTKVTGDLGHFHWSSKLIGCNEYFLLLEGHAAHLPTPKNHFAQVISALTKTHQYLLQVKVLLNLLVNITPQMKSKIIWWHVFNFTKPIACVKQKDVPPCSKCFAELIQLQSIYVKIKNYSVDMNVQTIKD